MHKKLFVTTSQARLEIFEWLTYYNARRRHSSLSYLSPMQFEQQNHRQVSSHSQHEPLCPHSGGHLTPLAGSWSTTSCASACSPGSRIMLCRTRQSSANTGPRTVQLPARLECGLQVVRGPAA